jgi:purine-binding chemotaxis protein CheW
MMSMIAANDAGEGTSLGHMECVTFHLGAQLFGLPIQRVHEVFTANQITRVPMAPAAIKGLLNLRGRVVTALCLRTLLRITDSEQPAESMAIGIESEGEQFALLVDRIGDVMAIPAGALDPNPIHMSPAWQALSRGVHRLESSILVVLDLDCLIASDMLAAA